jgi:hypothetical protein
MSATPKKSAPREKAVCLVSSLFMISAEYSMAAWPVKMRL